MRIEGEGDVAEILKLTCLEQGVGIGNNHHDPVLKIVGLKIFIEEKD